MKTRTMWGVVALLACLHSGCGTFCNQCSKDPVKGRYFKGVRTDLISIKTALVENYEGAGDKPVKEVAAELAFAILCVFDIPFSAVADTILLASE